MKWFLPGKNTKVNNPVKTHSTNPERNPLDFFQSYNLILMPGTFVKFLIKSFASILHMWDARGTPTLTES